MNQISELKLKEALILYWDEQLAEFPTDEELEATITFSSRFEKRINRLIKSQKKPYYKLINTTMKRVAAVIIIVLLTLTAAMSVEAIRTPVIKFCMEVYEKFSEVVFGSENATESQIESIQEIYLPTIPKNFKLVTSHADTSIIYHEYENDVKQYIMYEQSILGASISINTENIEPESVVIQGYEGIYYENLGVKTLLWSNGRYSFLLMSNLEKDELLLMAETLKEEK